MFELQVVEEGRPPSCSTRQPRKYSVVFRVTWQLNFACKSTLRFLRFCDSFESLAFVFIKLQLRDVGGIEWNVNQLKSSNAVPSNYSEFLAEPSSRPGMAFACFLSSCLLIGLYLRKPLQIPNAMRCGVDNMSPRNIRNLCNMHWPSAEWVCCGVNKHLESIDRKYVGGRIY